MVAISDVPLLAPPAKLNYHAVQSTCVAAPMTAILLREVLVSGLREYLKGAEILSVTTLAKWKTTVQMVAVGAILLGGALGGGAVMTIGVALLWLAALLTVITGWDYFAKGVAYIRSQEDQK